MPKEYSTVKVPKELLEKIDKLIEEANLGYRNRSEWIIETIRQRLLEMEERIEKTKENEET